MLTVGSLFSGIGGIDLGLERAGMTVIWQSEVDPYASNVLAKHWPDVPNLGDVKLIDWSTIERPDLVCGGFPCQPVSTAGRRRGQADERWLWPEVARCLRDLGPRWALLENVPGLLVQPMGDVLGDLATLGYDAEWQGIPAAAVGAPHLRWRIFIVAHANGGGRGPAGESGVGRALGERGDAARDAPAIAYTGARSNVADPDQERRRGRPGMFRPGGWHEPADSGEQLADARGLGRRQGPGIIGGLGPEGRGWWESEPDVGRVAHGVPHRVDRLRCLGNAVVPQVAEYVGRQLLAHVQPACSCGCHKTVQPGLIPCPTCDTEAAHSSRSIRTSGGGGSRVLGAGCHPSPDPEP